MSSATNRPWLTLVCLGLVYPASLPACRYNVRDVGFADLKPAPYQLFVFLGQDAPAEFAGTLRRNAPAMFSDANVEIRLIESDTARGTQAAQLAREHRVEQSPAAILAAPDGRSLALAVPGLAPSSAEAVDTLLKQVISSPAREAVLKAAIESFAVVLVVEGADTRQNESARAAAQDAIAEFSKVLGRLPKQVRAPPSLQIIPAAEATGECVLLWSIGVTNAAPGEAAVAILHGRGRLIGPVLAGVRVTEPAIFRILHVLGQDCECDLDRAWMRGPLFPARWGAERQAAAVGNLGFDPENPLVKAEMKSILDRGPSSAKPLSLSANDGDAALHGYKEVALETATRTPPAVAPTHDPAAVSSHVWSIRIPPLAIGSLVLVAVVALVGGLFILLKRRSD